MRSYNTARRIYGVLELLSWLAIILGAAMAVFGWMVAADVVRYQHMIGIIAIFGTLPGLFIFLLGMVGVVTAQSSRASVDTAELTGQILKVARDQLEVSKAGQRMPHGSQAGFESLPNAQAETADFGEAFKVNTSQQATTYGSPPAIPPAQTATALPPETPDFSTLKSTRDLAETSNKRANHEDT